MLIHKVMKTDDFSRLKMYRTQQYSYKIFLLVYTICAVFTNVLGATEVCNNFIH